MRGRVTMRDVAAEAGVSPMTVSRAFKRDSSVNVKTRQAVQAAADRLGYVYDTTAQAFRAQRSGFVAVTLPSINNANFAATHRALTRGLSQTGLQILLGVTNYRLEEEEHLVRQLLARRPEAIVLTGGTHTEATRKLLGAANAPVLEIWDRPANTVGHFVGFSNSEAMALVVRHLAQQGRRKLGFLGASASTDLRGAERRRGAVDEARRLGLPEILQFDVGPVPATMTIAAEAALEQRDLITALDALVCVSDPVAFGAMMSLQKSGLCIPQDLAITGFGNFEIAQIAHPSLTTVDVGADRIGSEVARLIQVLLFDSVNEPDLQDVILDPKLIVGQSSQI